MVVGVDEIWFFFNVQKSNLGMASQNKSETGSIWKYFFNNGAST